ncbi:effector-associated domain 2-containing protein [Dactylosporangium siamense]|uniref:effector-associated domain 2-containing protein n=1 Tax=Dactylosporangium siamense TaxID=685454 RepID=UPI001944E3E7|nr:hypothetical protein [Dactylosporangium siamense]
MTDAGADLATATVVVVGVGEHQAGAGWSLAGPVPDALRFAQYFLDRGVPAQRVQVLSTPLPPHGALPDGVRCRPADRGTVRQVFLRELPASDATDLYVVWGGHGFLDTARRRRLYLADTIESDAVDVDLDSLLATYTSDVVTALRRQLWLVDVCQLHDDGGRLRVRGHETFPAGEPVAGLTQQVLFAAGHGQGAADLRVQRTGLFSREVLRLLHRDGGAALLADPPALFEALRERFSTRRGAGLTRQTPTYLWYRNELGDEGQLLHSASRHPAAPVTEVPVPPPSSALVPVVEALLALAEFREPATREEILQLLRGSLYGSIRRHPAARPDAISIVRTCLRFPGGLTELVEAVQFFVPEGPAVDLLIAASAKLQA